MVAKKLINVVNAQFGVSNKLYKMNCNYDAFSIKTNLKKEVI